LDETDRYGTLPVVVVTAAFAKRYFPEGNAVGAELFFPRDGITRQVVGIVSDAYQFSVTDPPRPQIYAAFDQAPSPSVHVALRTRSDPFAAAGWLRGQFKGLDPELPLFAIESMRGRLDDSLWTERLLKNVVLALTMVALVLTVLGTYGLASHSSARRTSEFGIRAAIGALPSSLASLVLREAAVLAGAGIVIGALLSWAAASALARALPAMPGMRAALLVQVAGVIVVVALLASLIPALRAARVDPMQLLRST
jgi:predicted lysophospholipase L1 biosynthesis ABC-type transport system permease subunit